MSSRMSTRSPRRSSRNGSQEIFDILDDSSAPASVRRRSLATPLDAEDERRLSALTSQPVKTEPAQAPPTKKRKKKRLAITANLTNTRYDVVRRMCEKLGLTVTKDDDPNSNLIWYDSYVSNEKIAELKPYQRVNHFPGMGEVTRKDGLARNMAKMYKQSHLEFNFHPRTWILPAEHNSLQTYAKELKRRKKTKTFIVKPSSGAQGHGIQLYRNAERIPPTEHFIVQEYIEKPMLLDGFKFDLRIYVLMTSCDPLRLFLFNDGLVRLSTEKYVHPHESNVEHLFMHLTNYSINKHSEGYEKGDSVETGSKRSIRFLNEHLRKNGYDVTTLWANIKDMLVKTMIVGLPFILHNYRMNRPGQTPGSDSVCFEILGFDVMIDRKMRPWLLEINRSPSFGTDEQIDKDIKSGLIEDSIRLLNIRASDKRKNMAAQKAEAQRRLLKPFRRVDLDATELDKKSHLVQRRKEELKNMLVKVRKDAARDDFEYKNAGRFLRIFPVDDRGNKQRYAKMMTDSFRIFLSGTSNLQRDVERTYSDRWGEQAILDMLAECEADETEGKLTTTSRARGPKPLSSMPVVAPRRKHEMESGDSEEELEAEGTDEDVARQGRHVSSRPLSGVSAASHSGSRTQWGQESRSRSLSRPQSSNKVFSQEEQAYLDKEEEASQRALQQLTDIRIKFPGKTDAEAEIVLKKLHDNWKFHKPRIASYWLVKLDSIKRRKVVDIVRSNVRACLQRVWHIQDVDSLRLSRLFSRVFNRLLWSNGQGLWNCFSQQNSWESIFSKSADGVSNTELNCCRRVVQLCRECLLIVYQFAQDTKARSTGIEPSDAPGPVGPSVSASMPSASSRKMTRPAYSSVVSASGQPTWTPGQSISKRMARIYKSRLPHM